MTKHISSKMTVQMLIDELSTIDPNETVIAHFYLTRKPKQSSNSWSWGHITRKASETKATRPRIETRKVK